MGGFWLCLLLEAMILIIYRMTEISEPGSQPDLYERVASIEAEQEAMRSAFGGISSFREFGVVDIHAFQGGLLPERKTDGAIGFDAYARAIVDPTKPATDSNPLRGLVGDFQKDGPNWKSSVNESIRDWVDDDPMDETKYVVNLPRHKRLMVGLGFATRMIFPAFYWVAPRSGYAARGITVANSPGTVDPDYRGEAGALIENNSTSHFTISHNQRIVQVIFTAAFIPQLNPITVHEELGGTRRGAGGFGSTGTR